MHTEGVGEQRVDENFWM